MNVQTDERVTTRETIRKGDEDFPADVDLQIQESGLVPIWDVRTGEKSWTPKQLLPMQKAKLSPETKKPMFTDVDPGITPVRGTHKCLLHPDDPNRALYASWGLPTCPKATMPSELQVELHMRKTHPIAWQTIERHREKQEKEAALVRERDFQERMIAAAMGKGKADK